MNFARVSDPDDALFRVEDRALIANEDGYFLVAFSGSMWGPVVGETVNVSLQLQKDYFQSGGWETFHQITVVEHLDHRYRHFSATQFLHLQAGEKVRILIQSDRPPHESGIYSVGDSRVAIQKLY